MFDDSMTIVQTQHRYAKDKFNKDGVRINRKNDTYFKDNRVHKKCESLYLKQLEETRTENEDWERLCRYIEVLHDLTILPKNNITRLKDLRAGFESKNGVRTRKWRTGPDFSLMLEAYKLAEESIKWCIVNKLDGANDVRAVNYGMSIMINKLNEAFTIRKNKERQKLEIARITKAESKKDHTPINHTVNTAKSKDELDISSFI